MRNLEHPRIVWTVAVLAVAAALGMKYLVKRHNTNQLEAIAEMEGEDLARTADTPRIVEIRKVEYQDANQALELVEAILAAPASEAEKAAAQERHANILQLWFQQRLQAGQSHEAREFLDRLTMTYPESYLVNTVTRRWADHRKQTCAKHLEAGELDAAKEILGELAQQGWFYGDNRALEEYQRRSLEIWTKAGASEPAGFASLLDAASAIGSLNFNAPVARALYDSSLAGARLLELGDTQAAGAERYRSIPFYQAALHRLASNRGKPWRTSGGQPSHAELKSIAYATEQKLAKLFESLAAALAAGNTPLITSLDADTVCRAGANQLQNAPLRLSLWSQLISRQDARFRELAKPALEYSMADISSRAFTGEEYNRLSQSLRDSSNLGEEILRRSGANLWHSRVMDSSFDPWPLLPPAVRADFDARRKRGQTEESLRQSLASLGQQRDFIIPLEELGESRERLLEIQARRGLFEHLNHPAECVSWLRGVLAADDRPEFEEALKQAVVLAILNCQKRSKFLSFYELTSFLISDLGLEAITPSQQTQFSRALDEGAKQLAKTDRSKAIFLQAIQAEAYADGSRAQQLKAEAIQAAFEIVSAVRRTTVGSELLVPSGLDGLSVVSVDNSTEHHLLVFYRGPESFFVAVHPFRKLSAVLRDGHYEIAVIAPSGAILPYQGEVVLRSSRQKSNYRLESTSPDRNRFVASQGSAAHGEYRLARQPENTGPFQVDPRTGEVRGR